MTSGMHAAYVFAIVLIIFAIITAFTVTNATKEKQNKN